jgi:PAS domain S-box-containing protein
VDRSQGNRGFAQQLRGLLLVPTLGLLAVVAILALSVWQLQRSAQWVDHTDQVMASMNRLQRLVIDAETGARGYLLTRNKVFLEPWNASDSLLEKEIATLRGLVADNPEQGARLETIATRFAEWKDLQNSLFQHTAKKSVEDGSLEGKQRMDGIRGDIASFLQIEEEQKQHRVANNRRSLVTVYLGFLVLVLVGGPLAGLWIRRTLQTLNTAHHQQIDTIREQAEQVHRADAVTKQLAAIVQSSEDAILSKSLDGMITSWNPGAEKIFGYSENEAVGQSILLLVPPELHEEEARMLERLRAGEKLSHYETERVTKSGRRIYASLTISPIRDASGRVIGLSKIVRDITAQKRAAEAVRASEARFRAIFEQASVGIGRMSLKGENWLEVNDVLPRITGYTAEEMLQKSWPQIVHPDDAMSDEEGIRRMAAGEIESYTLERRVLHKDGHTVWVRSAHSVVRNSQGKPEYQICVVEDISERKRAEQELQDLNAELEARVQRRTVELETANQELEAFGYSVSHDLRAPLRTIDGFSAALEEDFADTLGKDGKDFIRRVRNGVQRMGELIDALLTLSRVTRADLSLQQVDISALATSLVDDFQARNPDRKIDFHIEPGLEATADPKLLRIAFENLIENAVKYTARAEHAVIELGKIDDNGTSGFFVRDNGVGFDMQYVGKLFGAFQRLHGDKDFQGSGIGLATVQRIVRRHGGQIQAKGEVGKGAEFQFTLGNHA